MLFHYVLELDTDTGEWTIDVESGCHLGDYDNYQPVLNTTTGEWLDTDLVTNAAIKDQYLKIEEQLANKLRTLDGIDAL